MKTIVCNECGHEQGFSPHLARMAEGVERTYLICEQCKTQYTAYYTDKPIRELQARQRRIAKRIGGKRGEAYQTLYAEYEGNKQRLTILMFELKQRVEQIPPRVKVSSKKGEPGNRWVGETPTMDSVFMRNPLPHPRGRR